MNISRLCALACLLGCVTACSSTSPANAPADSGAPTDTGASPADGIATDTGAAETAPATAIDRGTLVQYASLKPIVGATITEGGQTATTDAQGMWSFTVPVNTPVSTVATAAGYTTTLIGERTLSADFTAFVEVPSVDLLHLAKDALTDYDATKGIVYVIVQATGACADVTGGTATLNGPAGAKLLYFSGGLPSKTVTAFVKPTKPLYPVAVAYDVPPHVQIDLTVAHPTCTLVPFPAPFGGSLVTGNVDVVAGDATSVAYYFLQ
ncbi:MAG: hypothetical protein ACHREM_03050 [Polyangiales bacterium]